MEWNVMERARGENNTVEVYGISAYAIYLPRRPHSRSDSCYYIIPTIYPYWILIDHQTVKHTYFIFFVRTDLFSSLPGIICSRQIFLFRTSVSMCLERDPSNNKYQVHYRKYLLYCNRIPIHLTFHSNQRRVRIRRRCFDARWKCNLRMYNKTPYYFKIQSLIFLESWIQL